METIISDLDKLCVHTITTKPLKFEEACSRYAHYGVKGISIWRDAVEGIEHKKVKEILHINGLTPVSYVRGGFFPSREKTKRKEAIADNIEMLQESHEMEIPLLVLVCGADPGQSLKVSRDQIKQGIEHLLPEARRLGVKLAIEPLHPMYADTRSAITSIKQANDMVEKLNDDFLGVAIDVYHLWFDDELEQQIYRCGANNNLFAYHICDWNVPTKDMLLDRGLMGEGCIPLKQIRSWVDKAGFTGFHEVEIFSERLWATNQDQFIKKIIDAYKNNS